MGYSVLPIALGCGWGFSKRLERETPFFRTHLPSESRPKSQIPTETMLVVGYNFASEFHPKSRGSEE